MSKLSEAKKDEIVVVHLLRKDNETFLFERFIDSYRTHSAGVAHTLMILFKGFGKNDTREPYLLLLKDIQHKQFDVNDDGLDITAYLKMVTEFHHQYRYFCFLNSHSEILCKNWLIKLYRHVTRDEVGIAGATGLWSSHRGTLSRPGLLIRSLFSTLAQIAQGTNRQRLGKLLSQTRWLLGFHLFPNPHLRTNAFIIEGKTLLSSKWPFINNKAEAYRFESGADGLSSFIRDSGLKLITVDRNGIGWPEEKWDCSDLFFQGEQSGLLIADNQTRQYQNSSTKQKQHLHDIVWNAPHNNNWLGNGLSAIDFEEYEDIMARQHAKLSRIALTSKRRLVIYGAGAIGNMFSQWLKKNTPNIEVIGFTDSHISISAYNGMNIHHPSALIDGSLEWDYTLIASNRFYEEIKQQLLALGIDRERLI